MKLVQQVCDGCDVCARYREKVPRKKWGQPPFSTIPGHTVYADVVGPVVTGLGNYKYLHCMVDSATRMGDVLPLKAVKSAGVIRALTQWQKRHGQISVLVTDNASYYASRAVKKWCEAQGISH